VSACKHREYDFIVIGSGVAGLWTAVHLGRRGRVAVLTKDVIHEGSTGYAQGGVAVALSEGDDPELHLRDTLEAGDGLCDVPAVEVLTFEGPGAVGDLIACGAQFDAANGEYLYGREAAHSLWSRRCGPPRALMCSNTPRRAIC
jgi:L-aspartate oxidase